MKISELLRLRDNGVLDGVSRDGDFFLSLLQRFVDDEAEYMAERIYASFQAPFERQEQHGFDFPTVNINGDTDVSLKRRFAFAIIDVAFITFRHQMPSRRPGGSGTKGSRRSGRPGVS